MADGLELAGAEQLHGMSGALDLHQREPTQLHVGADMRTFNIGSEVFRMQTAHWISVAGGFSSGTKGSASFGVDVTERCERSGGGGGGSANSECRVGGGSPIDVRQTHLRILV